MISTGTKVKAVERPRVERRKAARQPRSLRISWRLLGNRDFHFGAAALKDIGTDGLALQVDQLCSRGTIVIVQFEGTDEPLLLQTAWSNEIPPANGGAAAYLMGCAFTSPVLEEDLQALLEKAKKAATLPKAKAVAAAPAAADPFLAGSAHEKRSMVRRAGLTVPVVLCRASGGTPIEAAVVDRSLKGLGILTDVHFARGSFLHVRLKDARERAASVEVQVRNCRQRGKQWLVGCHFPQSPPAHVIIQFG